MVLRVPTVNPRLANITAPQLPKINVLGALQQGMARGDRSRELRAQEQLQSTLQDQGPAALGGDIAALQEIALQGEDGAELAANLQKIVMGQNDQEFKVAQRELKKQGTFLASLINADPDVQRRKIFDRANDLLSEGDRKNGAEFLRISQLKDPLEIKGELQNALTLVTGGDKFLQSFLPQTGGSQKLIPSTVRDISIGEGDNKKLFQTGITEGGERITIPFDDNVSLLKLSDVEKSELKLKEKQTSSDIAVDQSSRIEVDKAAVKIRTARELANESRRGATGAEIESGIILAANTARRTRPRVDRVRAALDAIETGKFAEAKAILGPFIPLLNIDNEEVMQAEITSFILDELNRQSGTKTDFDFKNAGDASVSMGKTTLANRRILDILIANLDRTESEADQFINFVDNEGGDPLRFRFIEKINAGDENIKTKVDSGAVRKLSIEELEQRISEAEK